MQNRENKQIGHIISHTHWDREWRVPEWNARQRLSVMFERLLEKLAKTPDFSFVFDGQVVSIEDYLELYPQKRRQLTDYIKSGRLQIGPWYNLPDLYPVCGEALIRNLLIGTSKAEKLGCCLDIGYTTFGWGQTAQFPQIFNGFGINRVVCAKNVSKERAPNSEFVWQSPDGTQVFTTRLGVEKRANFFFFALMPAIYGCKYVDDKTQIKWADNGWFWHSIDSNTDSEITFIPKETFKSDVIDEAIEETFQSCKESLVQNHLFMGNGCDSTAPSDLVDEIIEYVNDKHPDKLLKYSTLKEYFVLLEEEISRKKIELKTVYGELRDGPVHSLSANALATRMPLKSLNRTAQNALVRYAEPFAALAYAFGYEYPKSFLEKAWQFLLLAHSHDAINGVALDKTARDTAYRLEQVVEIGQVITDTSLANIVRQIDMSDFRKSDIILAVFNPSSYPQRHITYVAVDLPKDVNCRRLKAIDCDGSSLAVQPHEHHSEQLPVYVQNSRALPFYANRHTLYLDTGKIPPLGYKLIKLIPDEIYNPNIRFWHADYDYGSQVCGVNKMANEYIEVAINSDATFNITDKTTGKTFENMGYFEDSGDIGDYWQRMEPTSNQTYCSLGRQADIYLEQDGFLYTRFVCTQQLKVPAVALKNNKFKAARSKELTTLELKTTLTLRADCPYLEVDVDVNNTAKDHRLRICMPTNIKTDYSFAQGHYNIDKRPISRPYEDGRRDGQMGTLPMQNFVYLTEEGGCSISFLNKNLVEYEVSEDPSSTVYLTLLRCMDVDICTEGRCGTIETGAEGSQCLGKHKFSFAVFPQSVENISDIYKATEKYNLPPRMYQTSTTEGGTLPKNMGMLTIDNPNIQISCIKKAEDSDGLIVRIYNPSQMSENCNLVFAKEPKSAYLTNMKEVQQEELITCGRKISLVIEKLKIVTVLIEF